MSLKNALAGIAVRDLQAAKPWYQQLLGREPDTHPMAELFEWKFERGGWVQVFEDAARAGSSSVTLVETDMAGRIKDLEDKGIEIVSKTNSEQIKIAIVKDPDGNQIVFAQGQGETHKAVS